jgi:ankyrin repeat protein
MLSLQSQGTDLWVADYDRRTALHLAATEGHLNVVKLLIVNAKNTTSNSEEQSIKLSAEVKHRF